MEDGSDHNGTAAVAPADPATRAAEGPPAPEAMKVVVDDLVKRFEVLAGEAQAQELRTFLQQCLEYQAALTAAAAERLRQQQQGGTGHGSKQGNCSSRPRQRAPEPLTLRPIMDKERRKAVHCLFKGLPSAFPPVTTLTVASDQGLTLPVAAAGSSGGAVVSGSAAAAEEAGAGGRLEAEALVPSGSRNLTCVQVVVSKGSGSDASGGRGQKRGRGGEQSRGSGSTTKYTKFVLYKENMDSQVSWSGCRGLQCALAADHALPVRGSACPSLTLVHPPLLLHFSTRWPAWRACCTCSPKPLRWRAPRTSGE